MYIVLTCTGVNDKFPPFFSVVGFSFYCAPGVSSFPYFIFDGAPPLFLVFLFFCSLLVSILGLLLSCLQMVYVEHDQAISISFESTKSPCPWCLWRWRFCSPRISSLSFWQVLWKLESVDVCISHSPEQCRITDSTQLL